MKLDISASDLLPAPRWFDLTVACALLLVLALPMMAVAVLVRITSPGPVFYRHPRAGQGGRLIRVWKFRSMCAAADRLGPAITQAGDPRITRLGRLLRKTKIDEWPQLFNVVHGDMAMVGPRPEAIEFLAYYPPALQSILTLKPGITDPATLAFLDEEGQLAAAGADWRRCYIEEILPRKLRLAAAYTRRRTWRSDLRVLLATAARVTRFRRAHLGGIGA